MKHLLDAYFEQVFCFRRIRKHPIQYLSKKYIHHFKMRHQLSRFLLIVNLQTLIIASLVVAYITNSIK